MAKHGRWLESGLRIFLLVTVLGIAAANISATPGPVQTISPGRAANLPGLAELLRIENASSTPVIASGQSYVSNELVVRFLMELSDSEIDDIATNIGAASWVRKSPLGLFILTTTTRTKVGLEAVMEDLWETGTTVSISPNYTGVQPLFYPDDPVAPDQWYLEALSGIDLDLSDAWDISRGASNVTVAVIDSGLRMAHPEFAGRLFVNPSEIASNSIDDDGNGYVDDVSGWDVMGTTDNFPDDPTGGGGLGHGTWVTSLLLANTDNTYQVAGMDHFVKVLPIRCFDNTHWQYGEIAAAFDYIVANPEFARIVNMSFGGLAPGNLLTANGLTAMAKSSILITGSGNSYAGGAGKADLFNPAAHPDVITVAGTDQVDGHASFSDSGNSVQFAAPAVDIRTASFLLIGPGDDEEYDEGDGTSFAAPMVAGIGSLSLALRPKMTKEQLIYALKESAVDLGTSGRDTLYGWGRVNAQGALESMLTTLFWDGFESGDASRWDAVSP